MSVYDRAAGKAQKPNWWVRYHVNGEEIREPGKGTRKATLAWEAELKRQRKAGTWVHPKLRRGDARNFANYARAVIARRASRGVKTAATDELGQVENHLVPMFGDMRVDELTFLVIKQAFGQRIDQNKWSGRTLHNIHSTLRAILIEAAEDGFIPTPPTPLTTRRDHLPPIVDTKPNGWRSKEKSSRAEIATLVTCEAVPSLRRVLYATLFLAGARFNEAAKLCVGAYDRTVGPWPCLTLTASKLGRHRRDDEVRHVPVFPELRVYLDWWLDYEYPFIFGRDPKPDDWLFPTSSPRRTQRGPQHVSHNEIYKMWQRYDLPAAGLTHRRIHASRGTLISALRSAKIDDKAVRAVTHSGTGDNVLDAYTVWEWDALCKALSAVSWELPPPPRRGELVHLPTRTPAVPVFAVDQEMP